MIKLRGNDEKVMAYVTSMTLTSTYYHFSQIGIVLVCQSHYHRGKGQFWMGQKAYRDDSSIVILTYSVSNCPLVQK